MKFYRVNFTVDIGIKKERIKGFEEFVKCEDPAKVEAIIQKWYGENGTRIMGKNITITNIEEI